MRRVIAALVVVGLAIGVAVFWPRSSDDPPEAMAETTTTTPTTSTSSTVASTSTTGGGTSTTSAADDHTVETVEEAEAILRELWFGWFEGIYSEDEDRIREVVVLEETVETAKESFGSEFLTAPEKGDISFDDTEVLQTDQECLAVWTVMTLSGFREGSSGSVHVLRSVDGRWRRLSLWRFEEDLWQADCQSQLQSS